MANNFKRTNLAVSVEADAVCAELDGGFLDIYDGAQPAAADDAVTSQVKLARLTFGAPAFGDAVNGVAAANAIGSDAAADATGTAAWFRAVRSDESPVFDGSAGAAGCDCNLNTTAITAGGVVSVTSMRYRASKG